MRVGISSPIINQMERIVQSVNHKAQKEVQHIRQARKDTVVLSAKALFIAEENKKSAQAEHKQAADPTPTAVSGEKGQESTVIRNLRDVWGYQSDYIKMYTRDIELRNAKQYAQESKNYLEMASREDITEDQRQKYLKAADVIKKFCIEKVVDSGNRILKAAETDNILAEKVRRKSNFEGITKESLGLFDLEDKSLDEIMQAIDDILPVVDEIAEKINKTNQVEYNENLSKYRPEYNPNSQEHVGNVLRRFLLGDVLSTKYNYEDAKVDPEKAMHFNPDDVEHIEGIVNTDPEYAIKNGSFSSALYPDYKFPR